MIGDEKRVLDAFCEWLLKTGWTVERESSFIDVVAQRGNECIYAEAKGQTEAIGTDVDTMYGQLLRRMSKKSDQNSRFAVVVPDEARKAVLRVPSRIRALLQIDVYSVDQLGEVKQIKGD